MTLTTQPPQQPVLDQARAGLEHARLDLPRVVTRIGGTCFIVGTLLLAVCIHLHGDLPSDVSIEAALDYIVARPNWYALHLGMMLADMLWIGGFVALAARLRGGRASALAPWLLASALLGATLSLLDYAIDGYDFGSLAVDWAAATGGRQADVRQMFETGLRSTGAPRTAAGDIKHGGELVQRPNGSGVEVVWAEHFSRMVSCACFCPNIS
jgi:hypothetical protein